MQSLIFVLDGITMQHAGDVIFQTKETLEHRGAGKQTYRECLEDVACAALLADEIRITGGMPQYDSGEAPGRRVVAELNRSGEFITILPKDILSTTEEILRDDTCRMFIQHDVMNLAQSIREVPDIWTHLYTREAEIHFGNDESLRRENAGRYVFGAKHYWDDPELERMVPHRFVSGLEGFVDQLSAERRVSRKSVDAFIRTVAVSHIGNYWTIHEASRLKKIPPSFRMPHPTRMHLSQLRLRADGVHLQSALVPMALCLALREDVRRDSFLATLKQLRTSYKPIEVLRERLRTAFYEQSKRDEGQVRKLMKEINGMTQDIKVASENVLVASQYSVSTPFGALGCSNEVASWALGQLPTTWHCSFRHWLRTALRIAYGNSCESRLAKIFPELTYQPS
jgi:hypothetical protein